jgi:hypothetical protein
VRCTWILQRRGCWQPSGSLCCGRTQPPLLATGSDALAPGSGTGSWGSDSASQGQRQPSGGASRLSRRQVRSTSARRGEVPSRVAQTPGSGPELLRLGEERVEVQRTGDHRNATVGRARPLRLGAVAVELDPVLVRVAQVDRLADTVVRGTVDLVPRCDDSPECVGERRSVGIADRGVVQPRRAGRRR